MEADPSRRRGCVCVLGGGVSVDSPSLKEGQDGGVETNSSSLANFILQPVRSFKMAAEA